MWVFPLVAAVVAGIFAALLAKQYLQRRRSYQLLWAIALLMYAVASLAVAIGALNGWSRFSFEVYWVFGAVLNVPFLAAGELQLLIRNRTVEVVIDVVLVFLTAYAISVTRGAVYDAQALAQQLPSGKDVFGAGTPAHQLPQLIPIPSYLILVVGALWSAWRMRGRPELKDRSSGRCSSCWAPRSSPASDRRSRRWAILRCSRRAARGHLGDVLGVPASVHIGVGPRGRAGHGYALNARSLA